jgi:protein disulfide-isomerase A1
LYPAGKKDNPIEYAGDRSIESLIDFIKEKGTHGIEASIVEPVQVQGKEQGQAAPAATPEPTKPVAEKAKEAAGKVAEAVMGDEGIHDEL